MSAAETPTEQLKEQARALGFTLVGVCSAAAPPGAKRLDDWLAAGFAGEMQYLADRRDAYHDPTMVLEGARTILMLGLPYRTEPPQPPEPGEGRVSCYAWGETDYHTIIRKRLKQLTKRLKQLFPGANARGVVDTAPVLERDFAERAGIGWVGKNTLLLARPSDEGTRGSYFFLAAVLTDAALEIDQPYETNHCGTCTACLDACPTDAFPQPFVLDARRCISYLTIESREPMPMELRPGVGDWLFGCDICQEVCPWNRQATPTDDDVFAPLTGMNPVDLAALFELDEAAFEQRFRQTPLWRARREGLLRNAAIVLGNRPTAGAVPALLRGLCDQHPLVRGACAWMLGEFGGEQALTALRERAAAEEDARVRQEIDAALKRQR